MVARGGAVSRHTALRALWWVEVELCHGTLHCTESLTVVAMGGASLKYFTQLWEKWSGQIP